MGACNRVAAVVGVWAGLRVSHGCTVRNMDADARGLPAEHRLPGRLVLAIRPGWRDGGVRTNGVKRVVNCGVKHGVKKA